MGGASKTNKKLAHRLAKTGLRNIKRLMVFVGKPFYLFIYFSLIIVFIIPSITGQVARSLFRTLYLNIFPSSQPNLTSINKLIKVVKNKKIIKFPRKSLKKKGVIFKSSQLKYKLFANKLKKVLKRLSNLQTLLPKTISEKYNKFSWDLSVFSLAVYKLLSRFSVVFIKEIYSPRLPKLVNVLVLKIRLKFIRLVSFLPIPRFLRVSKLKLAAFLLTFLFILTSLAVIAFWQIILKDLPSPTNLSDRKIGVSTKIYDRNGILLYKIFKDENRTPVSLSDIPNHIKLATIAIEDAEFYTHPGFSIRGIARAAIRNIKRKQLTGGSTITQQLVKNALLTPEKTLVRKLREITLAVQVELTYSKDEILEMYLNEVAYGGTAYGIQEAARMYFDKDVERLTLSEAALLAGLPKSPTKYSPFGTNKDAAFTRQKEVLNLMKVNGFISKKLEKNALEENITFSENKFDIKAPHFVMFVRKYLEEKYGKEVVEQGGLEVTTTLDYSMQVLAERVVKEEVEKLEKLNVTNGAVLITSPKTGEILAMVGSRDYFDIEADGNVNVTTSLRQPGSSIKIVNYAYALSNSYSAATIIPDIPTSFYVDGQPPYIPRNYEGGFRGNLSLRSALAESRNIPAVRVLASYGVDKMLEMGQKMGISTWKEPSDYGLSLTLGGGDLQLIELATAYTTIANYGKKPPINSVLKVRNYEGKILEENGCESTEEAPQVEQAKLQINKLTNELVNNVSASTQSALNNPLTTSDDCGVEQVIDPRVAFLITDILRDNKARTPSFGSNSLLTIPNHTEVAVKTGTSNNLRDNLTIGYNQNYLVAVWVGNNDNSEMARIASGITGASPIFNKIMSALLANDENHDWEVPQGLVSLPICTLTGTLACSGCPTRKEWFLEENKPEKACDPNWFNEEVRESKEERQTPEATPTINAPEDKIFVGKKRKKPWHPIFNRQRL